MSSGYSFEPELTPAVQVSPQFPGFRVAWVCLLFYGIRGCMSYRPCHRRSDRLGVSVSRCSNLDAELGTSGLQMLLNARHFSSATHTMSRLSNSLKALINAPAARPSTVPAPPDISSVFRKIAQTAQAKNVSQPSWLALSVRRTQPSALQRERSS